MIRLKDLLTEQQETRIAIGGLIINNANIEKGEDSVKITFSNNDIPKDSQLVNYLPKMIWNCTITLTRNGDMIDGTIKCEGEGKYKGKDVESAIMKIVDTFPKPADTNNFTQNILTSLGFNTTNLTEQSQPPKDKIIDIKGSLPYVNVIYDDNGTTVNIDFDDYELEDQVDNYTWHGALMGVDQNGNDWTVMASAVVMGGGDYDWDVDWDTVEKQ